MRRAQDAASAIDFGNAVTWVCTCCALDAIEAILLDQYYESFVRGFHSDLLLELLGGVSVPKLCGLSANLPSSTCKRFTIPESSKNATNLATIFS